MTAMRPSAECTRLATMAFKTGLAFFSVDKLIPSCFLLYETPYFQPER